MAAERCSPPRRPSLVRTANWHDVFSSQGGFGTDGPTSRTLYLLAAVGDSAQPIVVLALEATGRPGWETRFRDKPFGTPIAARLTRLSRCGAVFWRVTVCELLGQILRRQPIAEAPATTGGPSPRQSKAIPVPFR